MTNKGSPVEIIRPSVHDRNVQALEGVVPATSALERVLRRDRLLIVAALVALTALSWLQMLAPAASAATGAAAGQHLAPCCGSRFSVAFAMWVVMMAGMMIPSAAPMVLTHAAIVRRRAAGGAPF